MDVQQELHFKGMRAYQIAKRLGLSKGFFSEICHGKKKMPSDKLVPLAELLGTPVETIVMAFHKVRQTHGR
jgi:hypothetical protein